MSIDSLYIPRLLFSFKERVDLRSTLTSKSAVHEYIALYIAHKVWPTWFTSPLGHVRNAYELAIKGKRPSEGRGRSMIWCKTKHLKTPQQIVQTSLEKPPINWVAGLNFTNIFLQNLANSKKFSNCVCDVASPCLVFLLPRVALCSHLICNCKAIFVTRWGV